MSTKLSFRARALDPSKPMPIYYAEELPDLHEYSAINRAVPQMPSGMEKEEESEHHLQRAIIAGLIIPTPEVTCIKSDEFYDKAYPADFKMPRQLIHVQPLSLEQDIPDYDLDSSDELWLQSESKTDLAPYKFEQMMDRLEKITVCSLDDAKALVKRNEVSQDVFDYWVSKRLKTKHPLILSVKTDCRGNTASNNPYIAFRRRTEKMQTRKNRKNDETSYEKMLKLRRDLSRAVKLLEMVKRREKMKKDELQMSIDICEKRYQAKDFSGQLLAEYTASTTKSRPAFAPLYPNQFYHHNSSSNSISQNNQWNSSQNYASMHLNHHHLQNKRDFDGMSTSSSRKEKRQYKKRKHKAQREQVVKQAEPYDGIFSSDDEDLSTQLGASESEDEGIYPFRRNRNCNYYKPYVESFGCWPWESQENSEICDSKYRFALTSICHPRPRCIGFARRRVGRGGRILLDRASSSYDDIWSKLDFTIFDNEKPFEKIDQGETDNITCILNQPAISTSIDDSCRSLKSQNEHLINNNNNNNNNSNNANTNTNNNIVIKSENSKIIDISDDQTTASTSTTVVDRRMSQQMTIEKTTTSSSSSSDIMNQKLDDFEQLLDSANASSNIINKNLVCKKVNDISSDSFHLKTIANNLSSSELFHKSVLNSCNSDTMNNCISSTNSSISNNASTSQKNLDVDTNLVMSASLSMDITNDNDQVCEQDRHDNNNTILETEHNVYKDLMEEIRNEWLHFQPMPPSLMDDVIFESDLINDTKKFSVELQLLDESCKNETENTNCIDNTYLTQPMSFNWRNSGVELDTLSENLSTDVVNIKTEPVERDFEYNSDNAELKHTKEDEMRIEDEKCQNNKLSNILNSIDYLEYLSCNGNNNKNNNNNSKIGCSNFKLLNEKTNLQQQIEKELETLPIDAVDSNNIVNVKTENDIADFNDQVVSSSNTSTTPIVAPIAELQSHNYVLQYGTPANAAVVANNNSELCNNITKFTNATNTANVIQQQFVNTGNTIISSPSQQKMQSIVYDNNTFVLATTAPKKQLNGPADRSLNQNKIKQFFMLDLSQDKRKSLGTLNDGNLIKKSYSDLTIGPQNILVSSLNSNLTNSSNMNQQSNTQQFSLVHNKPIILGASTSGAGTTFMQSSSGNSTNKIIVTPSQLSGNIYMSTHGKLVIPSSNSQSIILDNAKMQQITSNQTSSQPQVQQQQQSQSAQQQQQQQQQQQKLQSPNQQRVKMENKMNMLIESSGEKNIIYAKYNKNKIYQTNIIPVQAAGANKNNSNQSQNQITTKQISSIASTQAQHQSISVISTNKSIQRIQTAPFSHQTQVLRPQIGTSSVNFQNASTPSSKIIQQSNNGSNMIGTVKNNDNSSTSPR